MTELNQEGLQRATQKYHDLDYEDDVVCQSAACEANARGVIEAYLTEPIDLTTEMYIATRNINRNMHYDILNRLKSLRSEGHSIDQLLDEWKES